VAWPRGHGELLGGGLRRLIRLATARFACGGPLDQEAAEAPMAARRSTMTAAACSLKCTATDPWGSGTLRVPTGHLMSVQSVCLGCTGSPTPTPHGRRHRRRPRQTPSVRAGGPGPAGGRRHRPVEGPGAAASNRMPRSSTSTPRRPTGSASGRRGAVGRTGRDGQPRRPCTFRMAGPDRRTAPFTDVRLESGDLLRVRRPQPARLSRP